VHPQTSPVSAAGQPALPAVDPAPTSDGPPPRPTVDEIRLGLAVLNVANGITETIPMLGAAAGPAWQDALLVAKSGIDALRHNITSTSTNKSCRAVGEVIDWCHCNLFEARAILDEADRPPRITITAHDVDEVALEWLWYGRIPLGKMTLLAGENDLGKTLVLCDIAMRVSRGISFIDQAGHENQVGSVLFISGEDDVHDTLRPRLRWAGADLRRIHFLTPEHLGAFTLSDLDKLQTALREMDSPRAIIIDPATAFCGNIDDHKTTQLRSILTPLCVFAAEQRIAIVLVTHTGKADYRSAANKILGSVGWRNAARAAWMFFADPDDLDRRLILRVKGNLCENVGGLAYRIRKLDEGVGIDWELDIVTCSADEVLARQRQQGSSNDVDRAVEWLGSTLAAGPQLSDGLVDRGCAELGIRKGHRWWLDSVLKDGLGGKAERARGIQNPPWYWCMPGQHAPLLPKPVDVVDVVDVVDAKVQEATSTPELPFTTPNIEPAGEDAGSDVFASTTSTTSTTSTISEKSTELRISNWIDEHLQPGKQALRSILRAGVEQGFPEEQIRDVLDGGRYGKHRRGRGWQYGLLVPGDPEG
jgi:putative DNA primase/helicase